MISKFEWFLLENKAEELEAQKVALVGALDRLRDRIADNFGVEGGRLVYRDFENIDVADEIAAVVGEVGEDAADAFNVGAFLGKVHQIIDLYQRDTMDRVQDAFDEYYQSLDMRIETLAGEEKRTSYDEYHDEWEGERSVLSRKQFEREKFDLQVELLKLQEWVKRESKRIVIVFEGRDAAGKGSTIKRFIEYLDPKGFKVVALGKPTDWEREHWFERYEQKLPDPGEIVFFDRSWHNRSVVEPVMGYCTEAQYEDFMSKVNGWEEGLVDQGIILIKFWFSITREKQLQRFDLRKKSPLKYWKFSPNDAMVVGMWDRITLFKKQMFSHNSTEKCPWTIVNTNDKKVGILNAIRYVLSTVDYDGKNREVTRYYPEVISVLAG